MPQGEGGRKTTLLVGGPVSQLEPGDIQGNRRASRVPPPLAQQGLFSATGALVRAWREAAASSL